MNGKPATRAPSAMAAALAFAMREAVRRRVAEDAERRRTMTVVDGGKARRASGMSNVSKGINVARLAWLETTGGPGTRIGQVPEGWSAVPSSGPRSQEEISIGATAEEAAAARVAYLESQGVFIPEPPPEYVERITRE